jgi:toxin ParE1/3/4
MARLRWSLTAERDLTEIGAFVADDSPLYAVNLVDRLVQAAERLQVHPRLGRAVPEYDRTDLREIIVSSYRLVYLVRGEDVIVVRVVHGARDLLRTLGPRPWLFT